MEFVGAGHTSFNAFVLLHTWLTRQKLPGKTSGFGRRFILSLKPRGSGASGRLLGIPGERSAKLIGHPALGL